MSQIEYEPPKVTDLGSVEDLIKADRELESVKDVILAADEDYGSDDERDSIGHLSVATVVKRLLKERDELRQVLFDTATFTNVHRSIKDSTKPSEVGTWIEQSVTSTVMGLKKTITQLQQDNNRLVDERRAADVHYRDLKVVYIAHPLSGPDRDANIARASRWCAWAFKSGYAPVADWIVLASQLDESYREPGLRADCALIKRCDEIWLCGGRVSEGMRVEAAAAKLVGVPVRDLTEIGEEPPEWMHPGVSEFVTLGAQ